MVYKVAWFPDAYFLLTFTLRIGFRSCTVCQVAEFSQYRFEIFAFFRWELCWVHGMWPIYVPENGGMLWFAAGHFYSVEERVDDMWWVIVDVSLWCCVDIPFQVCCGIS